MFEQMDLAVGDPYLSERATVIVGEVTCAAALKDRDVRGHAEVVDTILVQPGPLVESRVWPEAVDPSVWNDHANQDAFLLLASLDVISEYLRPSAHLLGDALTALDAILHEVAEDADWMSRVLVPIVPDKL